MTNSLPTGENQFIAYHQYEGKQKHIHIVFFGGFMSDMNGTKAMALEQYCKEHSISYTRFDYLGHGESSGQFTDGTISIWHQNTLDVIDQLTTGPLLVIGSSMGGWLMLLAALKRPDRIRALIGIASAPDFTEDLIWDLLSDEDKDTLQTKGLHNLVSEYGDDPYPITMDLITDGRKHMLLDQPIQINCPIRLIHGQQDKDVPASLSEKLVMQLTSDDVILDLLEDGDHRMSTDNALALLFNRVEELVEKFK